MGRGTTFEVCSDVPSCNIGHILYTIVWYDNKVVNLASNFITSGNTDVVRRWDKKNKTYVDVERSKIVQKYNKSMGGIDKLISYYRTFIKSRKWTSRMIVHAFDMTAANCWLTYIKDAEYFKIQKNKRYDLLHF